MTPRAAGQDASTQRFTFYFRPGDPLETNCAVADVRADTRRDLVLPEVADLGPGAARRAARAAARTT